MEFLMHSECRDYNCGKPLIAALLLTAVSACSGTPEMTTGIISPTAPVGAENYNFRSPTGNAQSYFVRAKDILNVSVVGEPSLTFSQIRVDEDGGFMMPFIGRVQASEQTVDAITRDITKRLAARYIRNPMVSVNVVETVSNIVTVEGAVEQPGVFNFQTNTTLLGAMAMAKGPKRVAKLDQVVIFREVNGQALAARFDLNLVRAGKMIDPVLSPNDRIVLGVSGSSQAWQDLLQALPVLALFTRI